MTSEEAHIESGPKRRWYAVHTLSGHENKVRHYLKNSAEALALANRLVTSSSR